MRKLFILGSPYWSRYLQDQLVRADVDARHLPHRVRDLLRLFPDRTATVLAVGYGAGLSAKRMAIWLIILAWWLTHRRKGSVVLYWIGSDVAKAAEGAVSGLLIGFLSRICARHICGAPWFAEQLQRAGIAAKPVLFPYDTGPAASFARSAREPPPLRVATYLTASGWRNMNGARILASARLTPDIEWDVIGMQATDIPAGGAPPPNMRFLGWVDDPLSVLAAAHAFVRIADHDAYSGVVRDALAMGKAVLYSKSVKGVIDVSTKNASEIAEILQGLAEKLTDNPHIPTNAAVIYGDLPPFKQQVEALVEALDLGGLC